MYNSLPCAESCKKRQAHTRSIRDKLDLPVLFPNGSCKLQLQARMQDIAVARSHFPVGWFSILLVSTPPSPSHRGRKKLL